MNMKRYRLKESKWREYINLIKPSSRSVAIYFDEDCTQCSNEIEYEAFVNFYSNKNFEFIHCFDTKVHPTPRGNPRMAFKMPGLERYVGIMKSYMEKIPIDYVKILKETVYEI